jgi:hypothetical protein
MEFVIDGNKIKILFFPTKLFNEFIPKNGNSNKLKEL